MVRAESSVETRERPKAARALEDAAADRPARGEPSELASADSTMTVTSTAPASTEPAATAVTATITRPLAKSTQRSPYRAKRSLSMARPTTSPGGVRGSRCCMVCPRSTDRRTRSITETHHCG